jgi:hypothetical protein
MASKKSWKSGEGDRDRAPGRDGRQANGSESNSSSSERLTTLEKTLAAAMGKIDSILLSIDRIDLSKIETRKNDGAGAVKTGVGESQGGLHFPKSYSVLDASDTEGSETEPSSTAPVDAYSLSDDGREERESFEEADFDNGEEEEKPILNDSDAWMINPTKQFRMTWDLSLIMPFLIYLAVMMPFRLCFANEARVGTGIYWFEFIIDLIFIMDIFFNFRTGVFVGRDQGDGGDSVEYDRWAVASAYFKSWCALILSCIRSPPACLFPNLHLIFFLTCTCTVSNRTILGSYSISFLAFLLHSLSCFRHQKRVVAAAMV